MGEGWSGCPPPPVPVGDGDQLRAVVGAQAPGLTVGHLVLSQPVAGWAVPLPTLAREWAKEGCLWGVCSSVTHKSWGRGMLSVASLNVLQVWTQHRGDFFDTRDGSSYAVFYTCHSILSLPPLLTIARPRVEAWPSNG